MTTTSPSDWIKGAVFATALHFSLIGKPVPCPRPRVTRSGQVFYPKTYGDWRTEALSQLQSVNWAEFKEPVHVAMEAVIEKPKKTTRRLPGGDVDNYAKSVLDAITKAAVWLDDNLVSLLVVRKRWAAAGEMPSVNVWIGAESA